MAISGEIKSRKFYRTNFHKKNFTQTVGIAVGCFLIIVGLSGALNPEFMGLHLSTMHTLVLILSGSLSIWGATKVSDVKSYQVNLGLGIFFAIHAIAGFLLGEPGTPEVGYDAPDELLLRIAPGFLELGTVDHFLHAFLAIWFITSAVSWRRRNKEEGM
jgi:hypothetical protein